MNTNEPKIELPEPPEGHRWEYRWMGWNPGKMIPTYCHTTRYSDLVMTQNELPSGVGDYHYWEAVPTPKTDTFHEDAAKAVTGINYEGMSLGEALDAHHRYVEKQVKAIIQENPLPPLPDENPHTAVAAQVKADYVTKLERENAELREDVRKLREQVKQKEAEAEIYRKRIDEPTTYPPPESEWPEKPAPPEGCEWVRVEEGEDSERGDIRLVEFNGSLAWCKDATLYGFDESVVFRAEKIDHTEGGKYRMLEEGEIIRVGDAYLERGKWVEVRHCVGDRLVLAPGQYWRRPVETYENFAQQAKVILQKKFGNKLHRGDPFIDTELNDFVDLIIKASKQ